MGDERRRVIARRSFSLALVRPLVLALTFLPLLLGLVLEWQGVTHDHRLTVTIGIWAMVPIGLIIFVAGIGLRLRAQRASDRAEVGNDVIGMAIIPLVLGLLLGALWTVGALGGVSQPPDATTMAAPTTPH